jgi:hypothetical protein
MNEENEPDWLAELAKGGDAVRRQVEPIVQAAQQFVRDAQLAKASRGPVLPFAQRVALAVDAGMREFLPERKPPVAHLMTAALVVTPSFTATVRRTPAAAALTVLPVFGGSQGEVAAATETVTVEVRDSRQGLAGLNYGQWLALVLIWLVVLGIPAAIADANLAPQVAVMVDAYDAILAELAVKITFRTFDSRRPK